MAWLTHGEATPRSFYNNTMNTNNQDGKWAVEKVLAKKGTVKSESVRQCFEFMARDIDFGKSWKTTELAEQLRMPPGSMQFGIAMSEVNELMEIQLGFHLTTRGKQGQEYFAEPIGRTDRIAKSMALDGIRKIKRSVLFLSAAINNHGDKMDPNQQRKLEKQLEINARRYVMATHMR